MEAVQHIMLGCLVVMMVAPWWGWLTVLAVCHYQDKKALTNQ
jgi:hypothetical protein